MKQYLANRNHLLLFMATFVFNAKEQWYILYAENVTCVSICE